jgi:hypothetical protein
MTDSADREPVMNLGHVAAWGAIVASQLTTARTRYTDMTRDNIIFVPSDNRVRVIGGASGIVPIAWPSEARLHHDDIALFRREFGSALCSALRLGYTYRLGPIGEWIFFEPENRLVVVGPPRGYWSEEWDAPGAELDLRDDCSLDDDEMDRITEVGGSYRGQGDLVAAKRCFMRCYLAALAAVNEVAMAAALTNLAIAYFVERRWCRVFALGMAAGFLSGGLPEDARDVIISLLDEARNHEPTASGRMRSFMTERARIGEAFTEMLWRLEDLAIQEELAQGT